MLFLAPSEKEGIKLFLRTGPIEATLSTQTCIIHSSRHTNGAPNPSLRSGLRHTRPGIRSQACCDELHPFLEAWPGLEKMIDPGPTGAL